MITYRNLIGLDKRGIVLKIGPGLILNEDEDGHPLIALDSATGGGGGGGGVGGGGNGSGNGGDGSDGQGNPGGNDQSDATGGNTPASLMLPGNAIEVFYNNTTTRDLMHVEDSDSINRYGRRFVRLSEDVARNINTIDEAAVLAAAALADLKDPLVPYQIDMDLNPDLEINDLQPYPVDPAGVDYFVRVRVFRADGSEVLTSVGKTVAARFISGTITASIDVSCRYLTATFEAGIDVDSLSPLVPNSSANSPTDGFFPGGTFRFELARMAQGSTPGDADYIPWDTSTIDQVDALSVPGQITLIGRDIQSAWLLDHWVERPTAYGPGSLQDIIGQIINDWAGGVPLGAAGGDVGGFWVTTGGNQTGGGSVPVEGGCELVTADGFEYIAPTLSDLSGLTAAGWVVQPASLSPNYSALLMGTTVRTGMRSLWGQEVIAANSIGGAARTATRTFTGLTPAGWYTASVWARQDGVDSWDTFTQIRANDIITNNTITQAAVWTLLSVSAQADATGNLKVELYRDLPSMPFEVRRQWWFDDFVLQAGRGCTPGSTTVPIAGSPGTQIYVVPGGPNWTLEKFVQEEQPVLHAIRALALQAGADIRTFRRTQGVILYTPNRTPAPAQQYATVAYQHNFSSTAGKTLIEARDQPLAAYRRYRFGEERRIHVSLQGPPPDIQPAREGALWIEVDNLDFP